MRAAGFALAVALSALPGHSVHAQNWEIDPTVELVLTYTDNLFLAQDGFETDDWIGQINPGLNIEKNEGRFTTETTYRMQALFFNEDSDFDTVFHQLTSLSTLEVAPDTFYIDIDAAIDQFVVDPSQAIPTTNVVATENLGDVVNGNINPYFVQQLGGGGTYFRADYVYGVGRYDDFEESTFNRIDDYDQNLWSAYIGTDPEEARFEWSLTYDNQSVDYKNITDYEFERAGASIGIPLGRNLRLVALGGAESDIIASRDKGGLDEDYWEAGFRANPGRRNSLELRVGERFFGTTYFGNFEYEGRVMTASVTYSENPTTSDLEGPGVASSGFAVVDTDPLFDDPLGNDVIVVAPVRAEAYISKTWESRIEFAGSRSLLFIEFNDEDREFVEQVEAIDEAEDGQSALTVGYNLELGARTDLDLAAALAEYEYVGTDVTTEILQIVLGVTRQLGRDTDVRLSVRYADQESDTVSGFDNYTEKAADLGLVRRF